METHQLVAEVVPLLVAVLYGVLYKRLRHRRVGAASVGAMFEMLSEDKRKAVESVVADKAAATDPESADGTKD